MKVLHIIVNPGHAGGAGNAALALAQELRVQSVDVDVVAMSVTSEHTGEDIRVIPPRTYPFKAFTKFLIGTTIPRKVDFSVYDIVHIHNVQPPRAVAQIARAARTRGIPYTVTTHGFVETATRSGQKLNLLPGLLVRMLIDRPLTWALSHARLVTALTEFEIPHLERYGVKRENVRIIGNGIRRELFERDFKKRDVRVSFGLGHDPFVLFVGNLKSNKGVDVLLKAAKKLEYGKVVVVGKGIGDSYEKRIHAQARELGDRVVMTGRIDEDTLLSLYDECTVFALPTRGDTLPLVILDAMAMKKPVVAARIGGIPEAVDENTGILIEPNDVQALAASLNSLLGDIARAQTMGEAGFKKARDQFTWPLVAMRVQRVYAEMLL